MILINIKYSDITHLSYIFYLMEKDNYLYLYNILVNIQNINHINNDKDLLRTNCYVNSS